MQNHTWAGAALAILSLSPVLAVANDHSNSCRSLSPLAPAVAARPEPAWSTALLEALTASDARAARLAAALRQPPAGQENDALAARARVILAGLLVADGRIEEARAELRRVPLDSEAALDAGLLMAESLALDDNLASAADWNLRVLRRWPDEPAAAAALVQRAAALGEQNPGVALAMLAEARTTAAAAAAALEKLEVRLDREAWFDQWLAEGRDPTMESDVGAVFYRTLASERFRASRATAQLSAQPALCARMRAAQLMTLQEDVERAAHEAQAAIGVLLARQSARQAAFEQRRERFVAEGGRDIELGRDVNRLRNDLLRDEADIRALQSIVESLPAARLRLAARAAQLDRVATTLNSAARTEVIAALRATLAERRDTLRNIAGSASLRAGELLDPRYRLTD